MEVSLHLQNFEVARVVAMEPNTCFRNLVALDEKGLDTSEFKRTRIKFRVYHDVAVILIAISVGRLIRIDLNVLIDILTVYHHSKVPCLGTITWFAICLLGMIDEILQSVICVAKS